MLDDYFRNLDKLSFDEFKNVTLDVCSDVFYTMFMYIKSNLPTENDLSFSNPQDSKNEITESIQKISNIRHLIHFTPNKAILNAVNEIKINLLDIPEETTINSETISQPIPEFNSGNNILHDISKTPKTSRREGCAIKKDSALSQFTTKVSETFNVFEDVELVVKEGGMLSFDSLYGEFQKVDVQLKSKTLCIYNFPSKSEISIMPLQLYFIEEGKNAIIKDVEYYPILFRSQKNNVIRMFALTKNDQMEWIAAINKAMSRSFLPEKYEILRTLGAGSFGVVKLAKCKATNTVVAIKTICKANVKNTQSLRKEVEILKLCKHPNIVKLYEIVETAKEISIVMEYLSGPNLLQSFSVLYEEGKIRQIIDSLSAALFYIMEFGIIHRDIKLENVIFASKDPGSDVKFVDFGLSALINPNEKSIECLGTLHYAAPELLLKHPYNNSVDIWSLGICFYAMLAQKLPFADDTDEKIYKAILFEEPNYNDAIIVTKSSNAIDLLKKMLTKDPLNRITIEQVLKHPFIIQSDTSTASVRSEATDKLLKFKAFSSSMRNLKNHNNHNVNSKSKFG